MQGWVRKMRGERGQSKRGTRGREVEREEEREREGKERKRAGNGGRRDGRYVDIAASRRSATQG